MSHYRSCSNKQTYLDMSSKDFRRIGYTAPREEENYTSGLSCMENDLSNREPYAPVTAPREEEDKKPLNHTAPTAYA